MSLSDFTSPTAIKLAVEECDRLGREQFLTRYGFAHAREYTLRYRAGEYDSKAIVGVAHGFQFPIAGPLKSSEFSGGISPSGAALKAFALGYEIEGKRRRPDDWTLEECEIAVNAYFDCLAKKLARQPFNRAEVCRSVAEDTGRTRGSVDYKFQNIDAILYENELPRMMDGIASNVQHLLEFVVLDPLAKHNMVFETVPEHPAPFTSTDGLLVDPPKVPNSDSDGEQAKTRLARKIDFAERDASNRLLGRRGEEWVLSLEKIKLLDAGREDLANRVDWVADRLGDGLGHDIVSFDETGTELTIEVKTTNAGILTPFFITPNELAVAERKGDSYRLYRVFDFSTDPHAFVLCGPLGHKLDLRPQVFIAVPTINSESQRN